MRNILKILGSAHLTPFERIVLQMEHFVHKDKTGEDKLTEDEIITISDHWRPKSKHEVWEYNRYLNIAKTENMMRNDALLLYHQGLLRLNRVGRIVDYMLYKDYTKSDSIIPELFVTEVNDEEAIKHFTQNSGLHYDQVVETSPHLKDSLDQMIKDRELEVIEFEDVILDLHRNLKIITGTSLYNSTSNLDFVLEYKKQVDFFKPFLHTVYFVRKAKLETYFHSLLSLKTLYNKLLNLFGIDLSYQLVEFIADYKDEHNLLSGQVILIFEKLEESYFKQNHHKYFVEFFFKELILDKDNEALHTSDLSKKYEDIFRNYNL
jgi:hypothetical protein